MSDFSASCQAGVELIGLMDDNPEAIAAGYRTRLSVRPAKRARARIVEGADAYTRFSNRTLSPDPLSLLSEQR